MSLQFIVLEITAPIRKNKIGECRLDRKNAIFLHGKFLFDILHKTFQQSEICLEKWFQNLISRRFIILEITASLGPGKIRERRFGGENSIFPQRKFIFDI